MKLEAEFGFRLCKAALQTRCKGVAAGERGSSHQILIFSPPFFFPARCSAAEHPPRRAKETLSANYLQAGCTWPLMRGLTGAAGQA